jgi:hypothetical protein
LVGRHGFDRVLEGDDGAGTFLGGCAQRKAGAAYKLAAGGGVARRLRVAGMRAQAHHCVDPLRARDGLERGTHDGGDIHTLAGGQDHRKLIAAGSPAKGPGRQGLL